MQDSSRIHYLLFLKCAGMLAVIGIHVVCTPFSSFECFYRPGEAFLSYFLANAFRAWAVPVFIMVSGALFLARKTPVKKMYAKYIARILFATVLFGTVYALMEIVFTEKTLNAALFFRALLNVYSGKLWDHMWFLYLIAGLYMVTLPLQRMTGALSDRTLAYLLALLFVFQFCIPFLNRLTGVECGWYIPFSSCYLFYYIFGYALHTGKIRIPAPLAGAFVAAGILWCAFGQFVPGMTEPVGATLSFAGTGDFAGAAMAAGIFVLAKKLCREKENFLDTKIVPLSFGVYIVHAVFINFIYKVLHFTPDRFNVAVMLSVTFIVTTVCSLLAVLVLRKIPFVKKYLL